MSSSSEDEHADARATEEPGSTEATEGGERKEGDGESPPKAAESDGRPTAGGKSISAMGGSGAGGEGKTGISDDSEEDEEGATPSAAASIKKKVVDDESEEEEAEGVARAAETDSKAGGKTGLSSDSEGEDDEPRKQGGGSAAHEDGDTEMADATHKDVFGDSDSDDEGPGVSGNKHKGQKVLLNKETGQLERGPVEDAPEHAIQDSHVGRDRRAVPKDILKFSIPELPRPPKGARLIYANPPKRHLSVDHAPFSTVDQEAKRIASQRALDRFHESASSMRWRFKAGEGESAEAWEKRGKESNARFVEWSDGSVTLHVGAEVLQVKHEGLERNDHHLYVAHLAAKPIQDDGDTGPELPIIEGHGILEARMVIKPTQHASGRKILASVAKEQRKTVDKDAIFIRKLDDPTSLSQQENARIRGQSRKEAARRRAGGAGDMNEDFLENDIDGDVGGLLQRAKRQRRQPNPSALRRAKDSDSDSSSDSSDDAPRQAAKRPAPSSSSSSSSSSSDEEEVVKKQAASKKKTTIESSSDSDD